jgi:hypothetical protein
MGHLTQYLTQTLDWHIRLGRPLSKHLEPGLSEDEILEKISVLQFKMPEEFIELYMRRNGTPDREWGGFIEYHRFLSFEPDLFH